MRLKTENNLNYYESENDKSDNTDDLSKLKECYDLANRYEKDALVNELLQEKSKKICISDNHMPVQADCVYYEKDMQNILGILNALALEDYTTKRTVSLYELRDKIGKISPGAEKEFVAALIDLLNLRESNSRLNAVRHITEALKDIPEDPRYKVIAEIIMEFEDE